MERPLDRDEEGGDKCSDGFAAFDIARNAERFVHEIDHPTDERDRCHDDEPEDGHEQGKDPQVPLPVIVVGHAGLP